VSYTKKELRNYLKDLLKGKIDLARFSFEYRSGHNAYHSRLRIILSSDKITHWKIPKGVPVESSEEAKAAKTREIEFSIDKLKMFIQALVKIKMWDLENCTEKALPDTALLSFSIRDRDNLLFEQEVWENCRNDNKQTKELLKVLAAILPQDWPPP
jgi:hypothetical protein